MKNLVYAINRALAEALNVPFEQVHNEQVAQGLIVPALFVFVDNVDRVDMLGDKSRQVVTFDIAYLDDTSNRAELLEIIDKMNRALYVLDLDGNTKKRAQSLEWSIGEDAVVHTRAVYSIITDLVETDEKVENLQKDIMIGG
mgnify:FL=1